MNLYPADFTAVKAPDSPRSAKDYVHWVILTACLCVAAITIAYLVSVMWFRTPQGELGSLCREGLAFLFGLLGKTSIDFFHTEETPTVKLDQPATEPVPVTEQPAPLAEQKAATDLP